MQITEQIAISKQSFPRGNPVSSRLLSHTEGNYLQVHEFLCRFYEVLGLEEPLSCEELEKELLFPWADSFDSPGANAMENCHDLTNSVANKLTMAHRRLLDELISMLLDKMVTTSDAEVSKSKWGCKKDTLNLNMAKRIKFDMLPVNQLTFPEVVRRYILAYLLVEGKVESSDTAFHSNTMVIRLLQGDDAICSGSPTGVAGVYVDSLLLGRAVDSVFGKVKRERNSSSMGITGTKAEGSYKCGLDTEGSIPEWAKVLDPVRQLPTNVGARIRNRVREALEKNPPEWAKELLTHSICKEVYKGNAAGPTKRAVIEVLNKVSNGSGRVLPQPDTEETRKRSALISKIVMKKCCIVLRTVVASDEDKAFCDLVGRNFTNFDDSDVRVVFGSASSRPLDLPTIDLRLLRDAYGGSREAFFEDVREFWTNYTTQMSRPSLAELAEELLKKFGSLYEEEVVAPFRRLSEYTIDGKFNVETEKELENLLTYLEIPEASWETGLCYVCGLNKDDNVVLLCDKCNAPYHTYCLSPLLSEVPEGNWFCPSCAPCNEPVDNKPASQIFQLVNRRQGEESQILDIATVLKEAEYWELGADKRTFLLKFLCDESLSSACIRQNLDQSRAKLAKVMKKFRALKFKEESLLAKGVEVRRNSRRAAINAHGGKKHASTSNVDDFVEDFCIPNDIEDYDCSISYDHLAKDLSKLCVQREFLGVDSDGRLYWGFPDIHAHRGIIVNENVELEEGETRPSNRQDDYAPFGDPGIWCLFQSNEEIDNLVDYLSKNDPDKRELRNSILHWQNSMLQGGQQTGKCLVENQEFCSTSVKKSTRNDLLTKATALLEAKYGLHTELDTTAYLKKPSKKNMVPKWRRCECLEPLLPCRYHCLKCHETFLMNIEFERHKNSSCGQSSSKEKSEARPSKSKVKEAINSKNMQRESTSGIKTFDSLNIRASEHNGRLVGDHNDAIACPLNLQSICKNPNLVLQPEKSKFDQFVSSVADETEMAIGHDGFGATGPGGALAANKFDGCGGVLVANKSDGSSASGLSGPLAANKSDGGCDGALAASKSGYDCSNAFDRLSEAGGNFVVPEPSLKSIVGKGRHVLRLLKMNLVDMEAALPDGAKRASRAGSEWRSAWCEFVKSADTIYEMVQATIVFETMIKTEYINNTWWWYWNSVAAAAKISTLSALALRIYTLDAAIDYQKGAARPKQISSKRKEASEKAKKPRKKAAKEPQGKQEIKDT